MQVSGSGQQRRRGQRRGKVRLNESTAVHHGSYYCISISSHTTEVKKHGPGVGVCERESVCVCERVCVCV